MKSQFASMRTGLFYTIVFVVILELTTHLFYWWEYRRFTFSKTFHDSLFEPHPYLVARLQRGARIESLGRVISATDDHTRSTGAQFKHADSVRVATLGGSTTFGTGVSDADTWPAILEANLGPAFSVVNYGMPGYSTAEAIIQMALVVPEFAPHVVVFYQGWNDIRNYHLEESVPDYFSHGMSQYESLRIRAPNLAPVESFLRRYSATWWYLQVVRSRLHFDNDTSSGFVHGPKDYPDPEINRIYTRNIETLISLSHRLGAVPVFVPQVLNYEKFEKTPSPLLWTPNIDNSSMRQLMALMNDITEAACVSNQMGPCVFVGSVRDDIWDASDFLDEGHFTREGGVKLASHLADIVSSLDLP